MAGTFCIHPKIGCARLGNSKKDFYLGPERTGGLPIACDAAGDPIVEGGHEQPVRKFKDAAGGIKRQAARFKIFEHLDDGSAVELTLADPRVERIVWTAHIANKKPIWFTFSELTGDLEFGDWNSYENQHVPLNNAGVTNPAQRKALMIDPGPRNNSPELEPARRRYFEFFRVPVPPQSYRYIDEIENGPNALFGADGVPLMPLNSGDNSVTNQLIYKFLTLTPTQDFFLRQWADGKFDNRRVPADLRGDVTELDRQVIGNLVGGPFSPGIETTWIVRSPQLYRAPFAYLIAHWEGSAAGLSAYYSQHGLSLTSDPQNGDGTEPGDLTKRMAIPWQADFYDCTVQTPNISDPAINQSPADDGVEVPPAFYVYWWPPQSPMQVIAGDLDPGNQVLDGYVSSQPVQFAGSNGLTLAVQSTGGFSIVAAGQTVNYARGVNSFGQMTAAWADLGFILNVGAKDYRYFVEKERNTGYLAQSAALGVK